MNVQKLLEDNILSYWMEHAVDTAHGGFIGRIDGHEKPYPDAEKGAILNARILWAFAAAYRVLNKPEYLQMAMRAKRYIMERFVDPVNGGVYWSLDCNGRPLETKKQTYAIGFTIYGLSEYARATGDHDALDCAISLYHDIERHAFCPKPAGYVEALTRDWKPIQDMRLSDKDENGSRTMNTHLHILEPYTNLYRVWPDAELRQCIVRLIDIFLTRILNPTTHHLDLFFDDQWRGKRNIQSFGHDIEACWLLHEAALVLGDKDILQRVEAAIKRIARAADEGLQADGSMIYERFFTSSPSHLSTFKEDRQRQWWVMCENVIGHYDLYQHFGDKAALNVVNRCLNFIDRQLVDHEHGEWFWSVDDAGKPNLSEDKAGFWKCPYHNTRMCLELIERGY